MSINRRGQGCRVGLGLVLFGTAVAVLIAQEKGNLSEPAVQFQQGVAEREQAYRELAAGKDARARFAKARQHFAAAADGFAARVKETADAPIPVDLERFTYARCAAAEMDLQSGKFAEARTLLAPLLKDPRLARSAFRDLALYYHGLASIRLGDSFSAGRSLNSMASFADPVFGNHARYLLALVHQMDGERAEAGRDYQAVVDAYETRKAQAAEAIQQPEKFKDNPAERARLEAVAKGSPPAVVLRAAFRLGVLQYEAGRFADAQARLNIAAAGPNEFRSEAQLLSGMCAVHLDQPAEAIRFLQPLTAQDSPLAVPALLGLARAHIASSDPDDEEASAAALERARASLARALELRRPTSDAASPGASRQRGELLLELAELHARIRNFKEASSAVDQLIKENLLAHRREEILQRRVSFLNLAGNYAESNRASVELQKAFPRSLLLSEVLFRQAENTAALARSAATAEGDRLNDDALRQYRLVIERFPESLQVTQARLGLALVQYRRGLLEPTVETLEQIPANEQEGDLALAPFLLADCLIRLAPAQADDAVTAGQVNAQLGKAVEILSSLVAGQPNHPLAADALLRISLCQQRLAGLQAKPDDRNNTFAAGRAACERVLIEYPLNELGPLAALQRADCLALAGDPGEAGNRLRAFAAEPLRKAPVAPLAMLRLAMLLRQDDKPADAVQLLARCRQQHEKALRADPGRAAWVPILQLHHAVALKEAGRFAEARALLEPLMKQSTPLASEAALHWGQTVAAEAWKKMEQADQALGMPEVKPDAAAAARQSKEDAWKLLATAQQQFEKQAEQLAQAKSANERRARFLYEAAWMSRHFIDREIESARRRIKQDPASNTPAGEDVPLDKVPLQPSEKKARSAYQSLIAEYADSPEAMVARLELGEVHLQRDELPAAVKLFNDALDKEPPAELTSRLRVRLGATLFDQGDFKRAMAHFDAVAGKADDPLAGQAHYRAAECLLRLGAADKGVERLAIFRDNEKFQQVDNVSDVAMLRLGQMLAQQQRWADSRQAFENLHARFGGSGWVRDAHYGIGWTWLKEKKYDNATAAFEQAKTDQQDELAGRAQLMLAVCQFDRQQFAESAATCQTVIEKHGSTDMAALAMLEVAAAQARMKQPAEARKQLNRVVAEFADTPWATAARERLKALDQPKPPHELPAAISLLMPNLAAPADLPELGQYQEDGTSREDHAVRDIVRSLILARTRPDRLTPAPWQRLSLPEPFEHHHPIPIPSVEERVAVPEQLRLP